MTWGRSRWLPLALFGLVGAGSVVILILDHQRVEATLEGAVISVDNLTQARVHTVQALLAAERLRTGDPTLAPAVPITEVDQALAALGDLGTGHSSILGIRPQEVDRRVSSLASEYAALLRGLRQDLAQGTFDADPVQGRLTIASLEESALRLEREAYDVLRDRLAAEDLRHRARVALWILFLAVTGGAFVAVRRARARSDIALRESEKRYAALASHAAAGLVRTDSAGRVLESTEWWRLTFGGSGESAASPEPWWASFPEMERQRVAQIWSTRSDRRDPFFLEVEYSPEVGPSRWFGSRWVWEDGSDATTSSGSWVGTFIDETEHRQTEDQLRQVQRLESVGRLTSGIAHDFNNLLAVILTNAELLTRTEGMRASGLDLMTEIERAARSGRELVAGLTSFSRKASLDIDVIDLGAVVVEANRLARRLLPSHVELETQIMQPGPLVYADARALEQILLNLVSNARDAISDHGTIRITVDPVEVDQEYRDAHPWVELGSFGRVSVSDTGSGMDAETLRQVFDPFFTTKEEGKGTGLGLATVHGLVRQQGGHVHAYSEPGRGTTLRVYFPTARQLSADIRERVDLSPEKRQPESLAVLLVDDDEVLRRSATRLLSRLGFDVTQAADGQEALEHWDRGEKFDMVISDISMKPMGGIELFEELRRRGNAVAVIFTSGHPIQTLEEKRRMPLGSVYLAKPWTVEELRVAVTEVFGDDSRTKAFKTGS